MVQLVIDNKTKTSTQAYQFYEQGLAIVQKAKADCFKDKESLNQAAELFTQAIDLAPRLPDPHAGMGYLFLILNLKPMAIKYFKQALKIDPNHPSSLQFLAGIQEQESQPELPDYYKYLVALENYSPPLTQEEFNERYDMVESLIFERVKAIMNVKLPESPIIDPQRYNEMEFTYQEYDIFIVSIKEQLGIIEEDLDTHDLKARLKPLEIMMKRIQILMQQSVEFQYAQELIIQCTKAASHFFAVLNEYKQTQKPLPDDFEDSLELLYNYCDEIADHLDNLNTQGLNIAKLEPLYEDMVRYIQQIQERLDELQTISKGGI